MLRRIPRWRGPLQRVRPGLRPIEAALHLFGQLTREEVTAFVDGDASAVAAHWPRGAVPVEGRREPKEVLGSDIEALADPLSSRVTRLLQPFDCSSRVATAVCSCPLRLTAQRSGR